jgi:hypothetical protein
MSEVTSARPSSPTMAGATSPRPVLLLTVDVPLASDARVFAVDTALESGAELLICDAVQIPVGRLTAGATRTLGDDQVVDEHARLARDASSLGVRVRTLVFSSPRPLRATVEVLREQDVGLLVFGPERRTYGRRRFRRHAAWLRREAPCLVWPYE